MSSGLLSGFVVSSGLSSGFVVSSGLLSGFVVSSGLSSGFVVSSGLLSGFVVSSGLPSGFVVSSGLSSGFCVGSSGLLTVVFCVGLFGTFDDGFAYVLLPVVGLWLFPELLFVVGACVSVSFSSSVCVVDSLSFFVFVVAAAVVFCVFDVVLFVDIFP